MPDLTALTDLCTPWCVHIAVTLRVAERISAGSDRIGDLARAAGCDERALRAVMEHLADRGVFDEPEPGRFTLNETSRQLLDAGTRVGLDLDGIGGRMAHAWATLPGFVQTGRPEYARIFGRPFWDDLRAHPQVAASFDALMGPAGHGTPDATFAISGGWDSIRTVVDVGGGTGAFLTELLRLRPWIQGTLIDLPGTIARAVTHERLTAVAQDFFDPLPAGADLYILRKVINDWPDREAQAVLSRCAEAARPAGRVVILRSVGNSRGLPIEMVLAGGRPRTLGEFRELASRSGLEVVTAADPIECRPLLGD